MTLPVPLPRAPLPLEGGVASWYEHELGWATAAGPPVALLTGLRFDVLELPAGAGAAVLRRIGAAGTGPVALVAGRMRFLVAAGGADELPGLLDWLEWGGVALELTALGSGGRMTAPEPPGAGGPRGPAGVRHRGGTREGRAGAEQGAAVWLRPPEPGREVEPVLPALTHFGHGPGGSAGHGDSGGDVPHLVRLVDTAAAECHRARLLRGVSAGAECQPLAFS
ncbi:SCO3374 family protein [Streptomyces sp. NBC_01498]|uniref:SCO3374 family protein n=1 Tax=Streptomyces sp. NBC_01498 TaxID=2975870 RepID=UPI002E7C1643|nr:SCO3374 family protein [Streptomyces sp. NBC_01498]WTL25395.1 SCO3374 family protein [Streptomyces sp. NBC_01498]